MNQLRKLTQNKQFIPFAILSAIAIAVWLLGPSLVINNQHLLAEPLRRLYITLLFYLSWILKIIFFDALPINENTQKTKQTPEAVKKLHALQGRFQGAITFLKNTVISKQGIPTSLSQLPWFLIIGPQHAGKTSLLANANINYILSKQFKPEQLRALPSSENCDWWATRDAVFIDVPGNYTLSKQNTKNSSQATETHRASLPTILWNNLLNLVHKHCKKNRLGGVVITLNLPEIIKQLNAHQQKQIMQDIEHRIHELRSRFGNQLPFYLVITKCDMISGFTNFFDDSSSEELSQAWGISLPTLKEDEKLSEIVIQRFNALINRLNKQLIWRLHQERNAIARTHIKDFPLQIERLKESLLHFLKNLKTPHINLQGIYLTSATQQPVDTTQTTLAPSSQTLPVLAAPAIKTQTYFIKHLLLQALNHQISYPQYIVSPKEILQRRVVYTFAAVIIIASAIFLGRDFQKGMQQTYSIQHDLAQYQIAIQQNNSNSDRLIKALPLLDALQQASAISNHQLSKLAYFLAFYSNKSKETATAVYQNALHTIIVPEIKKHLENYLENSDHKNPVHVYAVLKAYLMLGDANRLEADYIINTLKDISSSTFSEQTLLQLSTHIQNAFSSAWHPVELNQELILQARKQLTALPSVDLSYLILKNIGNNDQTSTVSLGSNANDPAVFISKEVSNQVPNMFTVSHLNNILTTEIALAAEESIKGNWILGHDYINNAQPIAANDLIQQLKNKYITNYVDLWESLLANLRVITPKTLAQTDIIIKQITSNHSPLLEILKTIQQNTALPEIMNASPKLQTLNNILINSNNTQENILYRIFVSLQQLHNQLDNIINTKNPQKAAFEFTQARMQATTLQTQDAIMQIRQIAEQSPEPLKTWLKNISVLTWSLLLRETSQYIGSMWKNEVLTVYSSQFATRYPFDANAAQEVKLADFTAFFHKNGTLQHFYETYLKPFTDDSQEEWQWRMADNQKIPLNNNLLSIIQTAQKFSRAFFPNGDTKISIQFTLQPMRLSSDVKSFKLIMNGQEVTYNRINGGENQSLGWPGNKSQHSTLMDIVSLKNQLYRDSANGDWGWFRIVSKALENVNTRKELLLNFSIDGHTAKYLLYIQGQFNPFLPANWQKLRLPEQVEGAGNASV